MVEGRKILIGLRQAGGSGVNKNTFQLVEILTGKALTETTGALQWWQNQDAAYYDIQLHSLKLLESQEAADGSAQARVKLSETKDNAIEGRKSSTYRARYDLVRVADRWYISGIHAED